MEREAWPRDLIGISRELGVRSKQLLAHGSLFIYSLFLLFTVYCSLSLLAIAVPVSADAMEPEWVARYNGPGGFGAAAMVLGGSGNVYVAGYFLDGITPHTDYATIKYDTNGNQLWMARYDGPESKDDRATALAVDNDGNVYVTGYSWEEGGITDYATVKYDTNGNQLWVSRYPGAYLTNYQRNFITVDNDGNVYIAGTVSGSNGYPEYATVKYDTNSHQLWVARYNGPMDRTDRANSIVVDPEGNCYVTGGSDISLLGRYFEIYRSSVTIKYNPQGQEVWVARYEGGEARDIDMDDQGNVYITGGPNRSNRGTDNIYYQEGDDFLVKYDKDGSQLWVVPYPRDVATRAVVTDHSGNAYVIGGSYTVKYNSQGNVVWVATYYDRPDLPQYAHSDIAIDKKGYIYVSARWPYALLKYWPGVEGVEVKSVLNQAIFNPGNTLSWDVSLKGNGRVDVYLAVVLPLGDFICLADAQGNTGAYNTAAPILGDWSILPGTYRIISYPFNGKEPKGEYQLYIIFTKPWTSPLEQNQWVSYDASSFTVP